jgi:hypothetical protein|nr:hypothetical protein [Neorhizobium tomejilense]
MRTDFMTPREVVDELRSDSLLKAVHTVIATATAQISAATAQMAYGGKNGMSIIEARNIEFDAAIKVAALLGVTLMPGQGAKTDPAPSP